METFFLVVRENTENESFSVNPKVRHQTFEEAKIEADRLCEKESKRFFIFRSVGFVEQAKPPIIYISTTQQCEHAFEELKTKSGKCSKCGLTFSQIQNSK